MQLSKLFGKQIYSLYEGEIVATVCGAYFDKNNKKIKSFKVFDEEENEYELFVSNIKAMHDCILIANKNKLSSFIENHSKSLMFKQAISHDAEAMGKIIDAEIDENGNILNFITDKNKTLEPNNLFIRKSFVYYTNGCFTLNSVRPKNKKIGSLKDIKVSILNINSEHMAGVLPQKVKYNPNSILGKTAKCDLLGVNNELIIKTNQIITEKIINDATKHNRLNQLYFIAV